MSLITRMRRQAAVYWGRRGINRFGQGMYDAPVEIKCRWEDKTVQFLNPEGEEVASQAIVYVDREMKPGDMLFKGTLDTPDTMQDPNKVTGTRVVRRFDVLPNLRNTENLLTVYL